MSNFNAREYIKKKYNKTDEKESKTTQKSSNTGFNARDYISEKYRKQKADEFGFETFEFDLNSMGKTIQGIYDSWQTEETMNKTRSSVEELQKRINAYQEYQKMYGGADLSELANSYKSVLKDWDNLTNLYKQYDDAESYTKEKTKISELNAMSMEDIEPYLKDEKKSIAYTTVGGQDITWQSLYDEKKHKKMSTSKEGKLGYEEFVKAEKDKKEKAEKEESEKSWWEKVLENMGTTPDTTLPGSEIAAVVDYKRKDDSYQKPSEDWTQEELNTFGAYWYEKDYEGAYDYAAKVNNEKALEAKNTTKEKISNSATSGFWGGVGNWAGSILTAPLGLADYLDDLTDIAAGRDVIVEEGFVTPFEYSQTVNSSQSTALNDWSGTLNDNIPVIGGKGLGDVYGLGTSVAQSALSAYALGPAGTAVSYFGQSAASGVDDALSRGATPEQALIYGSIAGSAEAVSEYIGADRLLNIGSSGIKNAFFEVLKQSGAEGIEETFSATVENIADNFVMQDKSAFNIKMRQYISQGLSEEEAIKKAWTETVSEIAYNGLSGFVSGGLHSIAPIAIGTARENKNIGSNIRNNERIDDMLDIASLSPQESTAYAAYTKYAKKGITADNVTDKQLGKLYNAVDTDARKTLSSKKSTLEQKRGATETLKKLSVVDEQNTVSKDTINQIDRNIGIREAYMESADELVATGLESGKDTESYKLATEYKQKLENGIELTEKEIANLVKANSEAITAEDVATLSEEDAALFKSVYDGKTDKSDFFHSFELVKTLTENNYSADYILEHKGVLSAKQVSAIYKAKVLSSDASLEKAITALKEKHEGTAFIEGTFDDSVINYDNTNVEGKVNWNSLNSNQKKAIAVLGQVGKRAGMDVELISDGLERGINGAFEISGNKMLIDIYAGMDKVDGSKLQDTIIPTTSHEMTHWMKSKSPTVYRKYDNYVFGTLTMGGKSESDILSARRKKMEDAENNRIAKLKEKYPNKEFSPREITDAEVRDEVIARASEDMFAKSEEIKKFLNTLTDSEKKSFVEKVKEILQNVKEWLNDFLSKQKSTSDEAKIIRQYADRIDGQIELWDKMLISSISANQALKKEGITGEKLANKTSNNVQEMARANNTNIDKYGYNADNISRANKQGELVNEYYYALTKSEWNTFYKEIAEQYYLATAIVGTVAPIVVNDKLIVSERLYTGKDAHDYVVIDAFQFQGLYDWDLLDSIKKLFDIGDLIYDRQTMYQNLSRVLKRNQSAGVLTRFDADSQQYVRGDTSRINGKDNEGIHGDSQKGITGERVSLRDKPSIQEDNELQLNSDRDTLESRYNELQKEYTQLEKEVEALKKSEEYLNFVDSIALLQGEELDNAVKDYGEWTHKSGLYAKSKRMSEIIGEQKDIRAALDNEKELSRDAYMKSIENLTEKEKMDFVNQAVKRYGTTNRINLASYLMLNGKMLDFSDGQGYRVQDHREISEILDMPDTTEYSDGLIAFMNMGNIRLQTYGIDISQAPNQAQKSALRDIISQIMRNNDEFSVDFSKTNGYTDGSVTYPKGTATSKILADIDSYFETGVVPEYESSIAEFRYSDRDTLGNTLTEAQQSYFAESKVRDENGNLKVMYHGTPNATFTKFRSGTYFTEHKWYADNYQNKGASSLSYKKTADNPDTYAVYLDIKKPFDTRNPEEARIFNEEYFGHWGMGTPLMESGLPDWLDGGDLQEFLEEQGYDYDGLILDEGSVGGYGEEVKSRGLSYVVFSPEQVKSVENKTPTNNPDYRYSDRDTGYMDAVNAGDMETAQRFVDEAAKASGYNTPKLYHGSGTFGFTKFRRGMIYATASSGVAMGYNRGQGLGRIRNASKGYIQNDGTIDTAIENAKNVLGATYSRLTDKSKNDIVSNANEIFNDISTKIGELDESINRKEYDAFWDYIYSKYGEEKADEFVNAYQGLAYMLSGEMSAEEILENNEWFKYDIERSHERKQIFRDFFTEEYNKIKGTSLYPLFRYLNGYEFGDALIDLEYGINRLADGREILTTERGSIAYLEEVIESIEAVKDVGIYQIYGNMGNNPLVIDEGKVFWDAIPFEGKYRSTDYIANWAKENGYTSVLFKTVLDPSSNGSVNEYADEYVFFDSEQIKSADTVTYDDNGNVIPLSERFNTANEDIRYSDRDIEVYDRTAILKESTIDKYLEEYAAKSSPNYAQAYITYMTPDNFLKMTTSNRSRIEVESKEFNYDKFTDATLFQPIQLIIDSKTGEVNGHEGRHRMVALSNAGVYNVPVLMFDYSNKTNKESIGEMVLHGQFNPYLTTRVQDVIPFSYSNREEIIKNFGTQSSWQKMKERYDGEKTLMYSDRDNVSVYDTMGETNRLIKENKQLKEDVERLKERLKLERQITHGNHFNENQLEAVAAHIRNIAQSSFSKPKLVNLLKDVYSYIATSKDLNWQDMFAQCYDIASTVLNEARPLTEKNEYFEMVLRDIRGRKIRVDSQHIQEARYRWGNRWRNKFFNRISISDSGISLDSQWQEWSAEYPDIFDAEISPAQQLVELYDIYDSVRDGMETYVEYDVEEQTRWLAREIYNQYWNVSPIRTTAEKYDKQIKLLNYKHREAMNQLRDSYKDRLKSQHQADRQKAIKLVKEIRDRKDKEIAEVKQRSKERMESYKDNAARKTKIQSITAKALALNEWLLKNSKEKHIHESLKGPVANLLQAIDFSSKQLLGMRGGDYSGMPTRKDISLQKALSQVKDMMLEASVGKEELIDLYGHDLDEDIKLLIESVDNIMRTVGDNEFILNQMTLNDLYTLDNMLKTIKQAVTKMNQFHSVHHARGIASLGQEEIRYAEKLGNEKIYVDKSLKSGTNKMLKWTNSVPYYAFKRFGEAGKKIFEALQDGWDKLSFNVKEVIDFTKKTYTSKEVKAWEKEIKSFDVLVPATDSEKSDPNYKPKSQKVQMTTAQVMYLYLLNKRTSAKAHLLGGGIVVSNIETKKSELISQPEGVLFEQSEIDKIIKSLTSRQIEVANALSKFMNTVCSDWGNEVSMARFGYKAFGEPDYVPMKVDKDEISTADPAEKNNSLFKLLNMSFTKNVTEGANNRLVISSIFDVFAQHTSDMAKYNALALPVLDAFKWYNYKEIEYVGEEAKVRNTVKKSIKKAFGQDGQNYITTLLEDINGQNSLSRDSLSVRFFKNSKLASVGMNLRVILLQPTSYFRASANIDNKYLIKALAHKPKIAHAEKYCGMALWKSLGYYDTNIQRGVAEQIKHAETGYDKLVEWSMKGAGEADRLTLGYLWNAAELEIRKTRKDLKVGSEEFFFEVGKRLRDIIYSTQVVDSTLTRSEFMRSPDGRDKILSMFASEPTLAYNILQDAYIQTSLDARELGSKKAAFKKNGKKIARAITAYTVTNAVAALVESGFDVLRDDDDEEMDIAEFMKLYFANFAADMSIVGKIPYLKDGLSILQGYSPSRSDVQWMQSAYYALLGMSKHLQGEGNPVTTIKNSLKTFSYLSGLSFYNAYRDAMATLDKLDILSSEELEEMFKDFFGIE